jgi:thioredoxin-like negative regulator of GroEL
MTASQAETWYIEVNDMVAALLLTTMLAASDAPVIERPTQEQAIELAHQGKHTEALRGFQQLASVNPRDLDARVWIGRMHLEMGHPELAESVFRSVMLESPQRMDAVVGLSDTLVSLGRSDDAVVIIDRAAGTNPQDEDVIAAQRRAHGPHVRRFFLF